MSFLFLFILLNFVKDMWSNFFFLFLFLDGGGGGGGGRGEKYSMFLWEELCLFVYEAKTTRLKVHKNL